MPFKNEGKHLVECIESILTQTHFNWQLLAVDDHSEDNSIEILTLFASQDNRITVFKNDGIGILPALQQAASKSSGEYITRMDADDRMHPQKLEKLLNALSVSKTRAISCTNVQYFSNDDLGNGFLKYAQWLNQFNTNNSHYSEIYKECVIPSPSWMMKMDDFKEIGGFTDLQYPEDYDFVFRLYQNKVKVVGISEVLHYWRDHPERASRNLEQYKNQHFYQLKLKNFLELEKDENKELILLGAGPKGKTLANVLIEMKIDFKWSTNNLKKVNHNIYGKILFIDSDITDNQQVIIAVSQRGEQEKIKKMLNEKELSENDHFFFFC
jgi:glycosyltransferase involved in cell wall biosynthesis